MTERVKSALDRVTRIRGVRGALIVTADDGLIVADALMEGISGNAVAALAASLALRFGNAAQATGVGEPHFYHLQAADGTLVLVPGPSGVLIVAIGDPGVNVGLTRLELLRVAEAVT